MFAPEGLLHDRDRALIQGLGLAVAALGEVELRQGDVQGAGRGMLDAKFSFAQL